MKRRTHGFAVLTSVVASILIIAPVAWAVCAGLTGPLPEGLADLINPQASGTKWSGPLTIAYEQTADPDNNCFLPYGNIAVVARLKKGSETRVYSDRTSIPLCFADSFATAGFVNAAILQGDFKGDLGATSVELKSVSNYFFNADPNVTDFSVSMDVELAVN